MDLNISQGRWVSVTASGVNWRAYKASEPNTSSGSMIIHTADKGDNMIYINTAGVAFVYAEYTGKGVTGMNTGLMYNLTSNFTVPSNSYFSNYVSCGGNSSNWFGATKIGTADTLATEATYGGVDVYSIHTTQYIPNGGFCMAILGERANAVSSSTVYVQTAYSVKKNTDLATWYTIEKHGCTYAAITGNWIPTQDWVLFEITCSYGYAYDIEIVSRCMSTNREGIIIYTDTTHSAPTRTALNSSLGAWSYVSGSGTKTINVTTTQSTRKYYVYFRTSRSDINGNDSYGIAGLRFASIKITKRTNVTVSPNGGTLNGSTGVYAFTVAPYVANSGSAMPVSVSRSKPNGVNWTVLGAFTSTSGGTQIIDGNRQFANLDKYLETDATDLSLYYHWGNTISYSISNPDTTRDIYCTTAAVTASKTVSPIASVKIATAAAKCASGNPTISYTHSSGFTLTNSALYVSVPVGISGDYYYTQNIVTITSPSGTNFESMAYSGQVPRIHIIKVSASGYANPWISMSQKANIPAGGITLTSTNVNTYFSVTSMGQGLLYTNNASTSTGGSITSSGWNTGSVTISSRGNVYDGSTLTNNLTGSLGFKATGSGSKTTTKYITSAVQEPNLVTDVYVFASPTNMYYMHLDSSDSIDIMAQARYTSGEYRDIFDNPENQFVIDPSAFFVSLPTILGYSR